MPPPRRPRRRRRRRGWWPIDAISPVLARPWRPGSREPVGAGRPGCGGPRVRAGPGFSTRPGARTQLDLLQAQARRVPGGGGPASRPTRTSSTPGHSSVSPRVEPAPVDALTARSLRRRPSSCPWRSPRRSCRPCSARPRLSLRHCIHPTFTSIHRRADTCPRRACTPC
jgi:hypothetical protein